MVRPRHSGAVVGIESGILLIVLRSNTSAFAWLPLTAICSDIISYGPDGTGIASFIDQLDVGAVGWCSGRR
jgi:hypothetical protein